MNASLLSRLPTRLAALLLGALLALAGLVFAASLVLALALASVFALGARLWQGDRSASLRMRRARGAKSPARDIVDVQVREIPDER
jgi:hypothetical protein